MVGMGVGMTQLEMLGPCWAGHSDQLPEDALAEQFHLRPWAAPLVAGGRHFGLSSGEGCLKGPICQYLIMAIEVLTGQSSRLHLANYSPLLEQGPDAGAFWGRRPLGALAGEQGSFQGGPGPAEVA